LPKKNPAFLAGFSGVVVRCKGRQGEHRDFALGRLGERLCLNWYALNGAKLRPFMPNCVQIAVFTG
jgi:hypothetical protein